MSGNSHVPVQELELAYRRWQLNMPGTTGIGEWFKFLGAKVEASNERYGYWTTEDAYRKIRLLAGPHWQTVFKILEIREK